jgi:hypothetical protein
MTAESLLEREKRWHVYLDEVAGGNGEALASFIRRSGSGALWSGA